MGILTILAFRNLQISKCCIKLHHDLLFGVFKRTCKDHTFVRHRSSVLSNISIPWPFSVHFYIVPAFRTVVPFSINEKERCFKNAQVMNVKPWKETKPFVSWILRLIWEISQTLLRVIQLTITFLPVLILYPVLSISNGLRNIWYQLFLLAIEFSGPIFVKLGQWASTRRDIFPEEFCIHLTKLQRRTYPHSWYYTQKTLEKAYGPNWRNIFVKISKIPVGSGCCAQVYKAWLDPEKLKAAISLNLKSSCSLENSFLVEGLESCRVGHLLDAWNGSETESEVCTCGLSPVAVKVLHPRIETLLRQDLLILKTAADLVTWLIPSLQWLSLGDCVDDFSHLMKGQVNFLEEAHNLDVFSSNFVKIPHIKFPRPLWSLTTPYLLVETYEEGEHMEYYVTTSTDEPLKKQLAGIGLNTILKMVFEDNFTHGDLHPGNMLVQRVATSKQPDQGNSFFLRRNKPLPPEFRVVILDCGIVSTLDDRGKKCLKDVFTAVVDRNGEKVADLFLSHSNHQCVEVESFRSSMKDIVNNALQKSVTLQQVEVSSLMTQLFSTMIRHQVKLDGSFSSVILAIMVLEGLGRSLDPSVDIVEKAKPFLINAL